MSEKTGINYLDSMWSVVTGCTHAGSPGCDNCYARELHDMRHKAFLAGKKVPPQYAKPFSEVQFFPDRIDQPLHWRKPRDIGVAFMGDLFYPNVSDGQIMRVMNVAMQCQQHRYFVLTKRPENMARWWRAWGDTEEDDYEPKLARGPEATRSAHKSGRAHLFADMLDTMGEPPAGCAFPTYDWLGGMITWPNEFWNVFNGVTICNQAEADEKIPALLKVPGKHWISLEPMLGGVDISDYVWEHDNRDGVSERDALDWVVVGCESGRNRRPCRLEWILSIVEQCRAAGVPVWVKQIPLPAGRYRAQDVASLDVKTIDEMNAANGWTVSHDMTEWPECLRVREKP